MTACGQTRRERFVASGNWIAGTTNEILERWAREAPDRVALVDPRRRVTFREYHEAVKSLAGALLELGIGRDDVIVIQLPNCVEFAIAINAAMLAGIPFCQIHHGFRRKEVAFVLGFSAARAMVVRPEFAGFDYRAMIEGLRPELPRLEHVIVPGEDGFGTAWPLDAGLERELAARRPQGDDLCRIAFTSGTTGDPKAVMHTHNTSGSAVRMHVQAQRIGESSAMAMFMPVGLNWGIQSTQMALEAGCKMVYLERFNAEEVLRVVERERITHLPTAPAALASLVESPALESCDVSSLEAVVTGGASCPVELLRRAQARLPAKITELYGMLEAGSIARTSLDDDPIAVAGTVGRPVSSTRVVVVDGADRVAPAGTVGEILVDGPAVMVGYFHNPAANDAAFTADGFLRTGDLGSFDARGLLTISGRKKDMIIRGGANVYPREIEEVLFLHPAVADASVLGESHPTLGETAVACVVLRPGMSLSFEEMVAFLAERIAKYKVPERLAFLDELPRTPTGKVQKTELARRIARTEART